MVLEQRQRPQLETEKFIRKLYDQYLIKYNVFEFLKITGIFYDQNMRTATSTRKFFTTFGTDFQNFKPKLASRWDFLGIPISRSQGFEDRFFWLDKKTKKPEGNMPVIPNLEKIPDIKNSGISKTKHFSFFFSTLSFNPDLPIEIENFSEFTLYSLLLSHTVKSHKFMSLKKKTYRVEKFHDEWRVKS